MVLSIPIIEPSCYEFGPFRLDPVRCVLWKEGQLVPISAKAFELLVTLVEASNLSVSKANLKQKVWPENNFVSDNSFSVTLSAVRKALGDTAKNPSYIVKSPMGYRFVAEVCKVPAISDRQPNKAKGTNLQMPGEPEIWLGGHLRFLLASAALYGLLNAIALLVEIAYRFDQFGNGALLRAPVLWLWASFVWMGGPVVDWQMTRNGKHGGLATSFLIAMLGIGMSVAGAWLFLPPVPITKMDGQVTKMDGQAYTAQAAYLKTEVVPFWWTRDSLSLSPFR